MSEHQGTIDQLRPTLKGALPGFDDTQKDKIIANLAPQLIQTRPVEKAKHRRIDRSLNEKSTYYAIHDEDLAILKELASFVTSLAALPKAPFAPIVSLLLLLFRYRKNRIKIDARQAEVLYALQQSTDGLGLSELLARLGASWTADSLHAVLSTLSAQPSPGVSTPFVKQMAGRWYTVDV